MLETKEDSDHDQGGEDEDDEFLDGQCQCGHNFEGSCSKSQASTAATALTSCFIENTYLQVELCLKISKMKIYRKKNS